jgi:S1-C subfamily serine protease
MPAKMSKQVGQIASTWTIALLSAIVGSWITISLYEGRWTTTAVGGARVSDAVPAVAGVLPLADDRALTNEGFTENERTNIAVYEKCFRSVVNIATQSVQLEGLWLAPVATEGSGSGAIIDRTGLILTNFHVVEAAQRLEVTLHDGQQFEGTLVGADPPNDLAVIRIDAPPDLLEPIELAEGSRMFVGQTVYAIGSPFGLDHTLTVGVISSLNRSIPGRSRRLLRNMIQIDAALNRGNSGGPLLNTSGKLVGINTAIASSSGEDSGVGFAIPVSTIRRVVPELITHGRLSRPWLGIESVSEVDAGLMVIRVDPNGPAARAGIQAARLTVKRTLLGEQRRIDLATADILVGAAGQPIHTVDDLMTIVEQHQPGETIELTVSRQGQMISLPVQLAPENDS